MVYFCILLYYYINNYFIIIIIIIMFLIYTLADIRWRSMKYNVIEVLRALEACYVCDYNPLSVKEFIELFCDRYELNIEHEERRIKGMLRVLDKQEKIIICDDMIYLENMLHSGIKLGIMG